MRTAGMNRAAVFIRGLWVLAVCVALLGLLASCTVADRSPAESDGTAIGESGTLPAPTDTAPMSDETPAEADDETPAEADPEDTVPAVTLPLPETQPDSDAAPPESDPAYVTLAPAVETVAEPETAAAEMPRLDIVTEGGVAVTSKETYVKASVSLSGCEAAYAFADVSANIRVRGNSTASAPKKPYRLKFDVKQEMLGLSDGHAFKNWCLMADYFDGSMLRTYGTFRLAEALLGDRYYSSDCTHVEVYLNGQYAGVYLLCEQTQIHKYRINIPELADGDTALEQGYLLIGQGGRFDEPGNVKVYPEITVRDRTGSEMYFDELHFALSGGDYTDAQKAYVSNYVSGVFKVVAHAVYDHEYYSLARDGTLTPLTSFAWAVTDEERQIETISRVFNIESAVSMCILDEIVKNLDAMTFNMYVDLSPEGDGVLTLAAPWDFDFSMANTHYATTHSATGFYATNFSVSDGMRTNLWYVMLGSIDWFEEMIREEWQARYTRLQSVVSDMISVNYAYDAAFSRDYELWGLPSARGTISHHDMEDLATFDTHLKAGTFVTDWLQKRLIWLNRQWGTGEDDPPPGDAAALQFTFRAEEDLALVTDRNGCELAVTDEGLRLMPDEKAYDPYFGFDYGLLEEEYEAEDYRYLEFTYRIPTTASADRYVTEIFLCAGNVYGPTAGISVTVETIADGQWHTVRIDLQKTGYWEGSIHKLRFDFFTTCAVGDTMYLKDFKLLAE